MKISLGNKQLRCNSLLKEGVSFGKIASVEEGDKVMIGTESLSTVVFDVEVQTDEGKQMKKKKMIVTDRENSELSALLEEFSYLTDEDGSINLMDLVGEECEVDIIHNTSKKGNIFANINEIRRLEEEDSEEDDDSDYDDSEDDDSDYDDSEDDDSEDDNLDDEEFIYE